MDCVIQVNDIIQPFQNSGIHHVSVLVQALGPIDGIGCAYNWITIGKIDNPESLDVDDLKKDILQCIDNAEYKQNIDAIRLEVIIDNKKEMKITLVDFLKNLKGVK